MHEKVLLSQYASLKQFEAQFKNRIRDYDFKPGDLVLVRNSWIEKELNRKTKPHYLGLMVVLRRTAGGSYLLAELDSVISKLWYAAFRLVPYHPHTKILIHVMDVTGLTDEELDSFEAEEDMEQSDEEDEGAVQDD